MSIEITLSKKDMDINLVNLKKLKNELPMMEHEIYSSMLCSYDYLEHKPIREISESYISNYYMQYVNNLKTCKINGLPQLWLTDDECNMISAILAHMLRGAPGWDMRGRYKKIITYMDKTFIHNLVYDVNEPLIKMIYDNREFGNAEWNSYCLYRRSLTKKEIKLDDLGIDINSIELDEMQKKLDDGYFE